MKVLLPHYKSIKEIAEHKGVTRQAIHAQEKSGKSDYIKLEKGIYKKSDLISQLAKML